MDLLAFFPIVLLLLLFLVILLAVIDMRQYGAVAVIVVVICVSFFLFFPNTMSVMEDTFKSLQQPDTSLDMPSEYQSDWIGFNQTQSKTISYHFVMSEEYEQRLQMFTFSELPTVDIYRWNASLSKFQKSTEAYPFNYTLSVSKGNHSITLYNIYERLMSNQTTNFDASSLSWLFPIYNNDTVNLTVTLDTHNLPLSRDMVFLIPMHDHTIIVDNTPPEPQPTETVDYWQYVPLVVSISSCVIVIVVNYTYRSYRRELRIRREQAQLSRRYYSEARLNTIEIPPPRPRTRSSGRTICNSTEYGFSLPEKYSDYHYATKIPRANVENNIDQYRNNGYWTKVVNISSTESVIYISNWMQKEVELKGIPEWRRIRPT